MVSSFHNQRGGAVVEMALIIVLFTAMIWGFFELFLMSWLKFASIEAAYRASRARLVGMSGSATNPEILMYWPTRLSTSLWVVPDVSSKSELTKDLPPQSNFDASQPPLREVTATVKAYFPRLSILSNWAHAHTDVQAQQTALMSPGGSMDLMDRSYPDGQRDP